MFKKKFNLISLISYSIVSMYFDFLYTFPGFKNQRPWDFKERIFLKSFLQVSRVKNERYSNVKFLKDFLFFGQTDDVRYWGYNGFFSPCVYRKQCMYCTGKQTNYHYGDKHNN